jgi:hypothetical protein
MSTPDHRKASLRESDRLSTAILHSRSFQEHHDETDDSENLDPCILAGGLSPGRGRVSASPSFAASALASLDPDHDGTVDLAEAKAAASAVFDKLEKDHDGTLDHKELQGRISAKDWAVADPDNDKTVSKDEYLAYVEVLFKKADPDNDGTIDAKELASPAGHALLRLLK